MAFGTETDLPDTQSEVSMAESLASEDEHYTDVLIGILIELCTRKTDPFSVQLMLKNVKAVFAVFYEEIKISAWLELFNVLIDADRFDIDQRGQTEFSTDTPDLEVLDGESVEDLNEIFDAISIDADSDELRKTMSEARLKKEFEHDLGCASARVLSLASFPIRKSPKKDVICTCCDLFLSEPSLPMKRTACFSLCLIS